MSTPAAVAAPRTRPVVHTRGGTFSALGNRDFRFLLGGRMAANAAMWVQTIAQGWLVLELTGSSVALGSVSFIRGIAMLLSAPFGSLPMGTMVVIAGLPPSVAVFCHAAVAVNGALLALSPTLRAMR